MNKQQKHDEGVTEYADEACNLRHKLNIDTDKQLHYFVQGLRPSLKKLVLRSQPCNMTEAIQFAQAEEAAQRVQVEDDPNHISQSETKTNLLWAKLQSSLWRNHLDLGYQD